MLSIDLHGRHAFVAGVADDKGYGFAIAKALIEAGARVSVGTWPPAWNIFKMLLARGKLDASRRLANGDLLEFANIYPLDAAFDALSDRWTVHVVDPQVPPPSPEPTPTLAPTEPGPTEPRPTETATSSATPAVPEIRPRAWLPRLGRP